MLDKDRLVTTFCDIVQIDSPSGEEEEVAQDLGRRLTDLGFTIARDAHGNLLASEEGSDPLMLSAHMDTVEPGRGIKPRIVGDEVHTDGTTILGGDCKAGIAAILEALESIREDGLQRIPVQLVFTRGEEIGLVGAWNLDFSMVQARQAVVFDGNGPVNTVITASPSYVGFDVHVTGRAAHAGVEPEKGLNAIRIAADIIGRLPQGRLDEETTINVGLISGGSVRNAVPEEASFSGEFRSRNTETLELLRLQVEDAFAKARDDYKEAKIIGDLKVQFHTYNLPSDHVMVQRATGVLGDLGLRPELKPTGGGTDANVFNRHGIPAVVVGMSTNLMHTKNEYVDIPDLFDTAKFCQALLLKR
ncbi:MAG: M20/M25/M40 family metallo-hydrolase [Chloroflexota bacterium]|nr:M20/M25/M40 family metallo-hydrolase [Chloroflexota bacterium]